MPSPRTHLIASEGSPLITACGKHLTPKLFVSKDPVHVDCSGCQGVLASGDVADKPWAMRGYHYTADLADGEDS